MARVLVLFHSRTGNTAALADAIADGARGVRFTEVDVRRLDDLAPPAASGEGPRHRHPALDDVSAVADYDALVLGGAARHGVMAAELARFLDQLDPLRERGALVDMVGAAFTSTPPAHGGHGLALLSIVAPLCGLGMLLVPPAHADPASAGGSPLGATSTGAPTDAELADARRLGARVAKVAGWVRHAKGHEAADGGGHHHH